MKDDKIDQLLAEWSETRAPKPEKRDEIIHNILDGNGLYTSPTRKKQRTSLLFLVFGGSTTALLILFAILISQLILTTRDIPELSAAPAIQPSTEIRVSLLVLERRGETAVEILEDTVLTAGDQNVYERSIGGHKLFFWFLALEQSVFSLDIGIDNAAETGIVAVPDKTKAVHLTADGRQFDVFVSIM